MSHDESNNEGRRRFLKVATGTVALGVTLGSIPRALQAQDLPHLSPTDPTASALKYTEDASKATGRKDAKDACMNCNFYQGKAAAAWGPCQLFPGKSVAAAGWCVSHALMI